MSHHSTPAAQQTEQLFIDHAARKATDSPVLPGDPEAGRLLADARANIYYWPVDFAGFEADITVTEESLSHAGRLRAENCREFSLELPDSPATVWAREQVGEILAHREHPSSSRMSSKSGVTFGDDHAVYGRQVIFQGDRMKSFYRIRDGKLTQIGRAYGGNSFVINIDDHQDCDGRFAARVYTAFYRSEADGRLVKVETFFDRYERIGDVFLPVERRCTVAEHDGFPTTRSIVFAGHALG